MPWPVARHGHAFSEGRFGLVALTSAVQEISQAFVALHGALIFRNAWMTSSELVTQLRRCLKCGFCLRGHRCRWRRCRATLEEQQVPSLLGRGRGRRPAGAAGRDVQRRGQRGAWGRRGHPVYQAVRPDAAARPWPGRARGPLAAGGVVAPSPGRVDPVGEQDGEGPRGEVDDDRRAGVAGVAGGAGPERRPCTSAGPARSRARGRRREACVVVGDQSATLLRLRTRWPR